MLYTKGSNVHHKDFIKTLLPFAVALSFFASSHSTLSFKFKFLKNSKRPLFGNLGNVTILKLEIMFIK
jgi:hypothetical protein